MKTTSPISFTVVVILGASFGFLLNAGTQRSAPTFPEPGANWRVDSHPSNTPEIATPPPASTNRTIPAPDLQHWAENISYQCIQKDIKDTKFTRWSALHPHEALAKTKLLKDPYMRENAGRTMIIEWAEEDFERAHNFVATLTDPEFRVAGFQALGSVMARTAPQEGWNYSSGLGAADKKAFQQFLLFNLAEDNGALAAKLIATESDPKVCADAVTSLAYGWAKSDPRAMAEFAVQQLTGHSEPNYNPFHDALSNSIYQWLNAEPFAVAEWIKTLPEGKNRQHAATAFFMNVSNRDVAMTKEFASMFQGDEFRIAVEHLMNGWGYSDGPAASQYLSTINDEAAFTKGAESLAIVWAHRNPTECAAWLETLPAGTGRDRATSVLATQIANRDSASALQWAATISGSAEREKSMLQLGTAWMQKEPASARNWITQSSLISPELRQQLLEN